MKKLLVAGLALIGVLAILVVGLVLVFGAFAAMGKEGVPSRLILEADFERGVVEAIPDDPFAEYTMQGVLSIRDVVDALDRGAEDRRVRGFIARIGGSGLSLAHIQEIRDAVARFRATGKPTLAFAETFGEFGPGNGGYLLATAFDEVHLQPSGDVGLTGLIYESPFVRGALEKLGLTPRMDQRHEYKNAMNFYTDRSFTEPHREALNAVMQSQFAQMVRGVAEGRGLTEDEVRRLFDRGPFVGEEAIEAGLVDSLGYRDQVYAAFKTKADDKARWLYLDRYLARAGRPHSRGETIALVHAVGAVTRGSSHYSAIDGSATMGSDTVAGALRAAAEDSKVRAIVLRVDSPGGSYVASDTIWRETVRAREAGKPVIVSMGAVAGSGGYFVAMDATKIVAQPGTITGSIGVLAGKLLTSGLWEKLGISWDEVHTSANAAMWTGTKDYSPAEWERFQLALDRIYGDFTAKVAAGRHLPLERVQEIARGRIWSGEDALRLGLVDELGGLDVALRLAREAAGLAVDAPIRLKRFPPRRSAFEMFFDRGADSSEQARQVASTAQTLRQLQPMVRVLRELGGIADPGVLTMPGAAPLP